VVTFLQREPAARLDDDTLDLMALGAKGAAVISGALKSPDLKKILHCLLPSPSSQNLPIARMFSS
jgi:hypothetical protein